MELTAVDIRNVRIVEQAAFEPGRINLLVGPNAAGKTSILEALHLLGAGRSFTPGRSDGLIRNGGDWLRVVARVGRSDGGEHRVGLEKPRRGSIRARMDGAGVERLADLAAAVPVLALHPGSHEILAGGPGERRRLLDWGLFHVEQDYHRTWQRFRRALAQRNELLRRGAGDREIEVWEPALAEAGEAISAWRAAYTEAIERELVELVPAVLAPSPTVALEYRRGWPAEMSLATALASRRRADRGQWVTGAGPHRAELIVRLGGEDSRHRVSRGQQKLLVYLVRLAQARHLRAAGRGRPILLLDDVAAELDAGHRERVLGAVAAVEAQLFVTALDTAALPAAFVDRASLFHVEQGRVTEVLQ